MSVVECIEALQDNELMLAFVDLAPHQMLKVPTWFFRMIHANTGEEVGKINLRSETTRDIELYAGHIGYSVHEPHRGKHYAARSVMLLLPLARELKLDPLWITCDPANLASRRSCELAGAEFIGIIDIPPEYPGYTLGQRQKCRYRLPP